MADAFEEHRSHLMSVAYRLLGTQADAQDVVQEAWLRWHAADQTAIDDPRAWLTTVTGRIGLDQLRSARVRRETYVGQWLPEPTVRLLPSGIDAHPDPAEVVVRSDEVGYALLAVMERLTPEQRVALVLHDAFAVPFDEIAATLGTTVEAARQHASRARRAVTADGVPRHTADLAEQRRVLQAFSAAVAQGDLAALVAVLAPDAQAFGDGGGFAPAARHPLQGADRVARLVLGLQHTYGQHGLRLVHAFVNGDLGLVADVTLPNGSTLRSVMAFAVDAGRVTAVFSQLNPDKLAHLPT